MRGLYGLPERAGGKPIDLLFQGLCLHCQSREIDEKFSHGRTETYTYFLCKAAPNFTAAFGYAERPCTKRDALYCQIAGGRMLGAKDDD